jgi:mono/diheme cytochrome c family protein
MSCGLTRPQVTARLLGLSIALASAGALAQEQFEPAQIKRGAAMYSQNCAACHGPRMADPAGAFDLRLFPPGEKSRFLTSVAKGKNQMPPWGDLFSAEEIEALWAYVMAGEKK